MNEIDIRKAICQHIGYTEHTRWVLPELTLDWMAECEATLCSDQAGEYDHTVCTLVARDRDLRITGNPLYPYRGIRSTALQRAEAFLKTVGKWIDAPGAPKAE